MSSVESLEAHDVGTVPYWGSESLLEATRLAELRVPGRFTGDLQQIRRELARMFAVPEQFVAVTGRLLVIRGTPGAFDHREMYRSRIEGALQTAEQSDQPDLPTKNESDPEGQRPEVTLLATVVREAAERRVDVQTLLRQAGLDAADRSHITAATGECSLRSLALLSRYLGIPTGTVLGLPTPSRRRRRRRRS